MRDEASDTAAELEAFVLAYQDFIRRGDREGLASVFHPTSTVSYPDDGSLVCVTGAAFLDEVADLVAAGVTVDERSRSLAIDVEGAVANLRVDFALQVGDERFEGTDYYSVVRLSSRWQITHKLYDMIRIA